MKIEIIEGIKRVSIKIPKQPYIVEDKEELINILNKKYNLGIKELFGAYDDDENHNQCHVFYK